MQIGSENADLCHQLKKFVFCKRDLLSQIECEGEGGRYVRRPLLEYNVTAWQTETFIGWLIEAPRPAVGQRKQSCYRKPCRLNYFHYPATSLDLSQLKKLFCSFIGQLNVQPLSTLSLSIPKKDSWWHNEQVSHYDQRWEPIHGLASGQWESILTWHPCASTALLHKYLLRGRLKKRKQAKKFLFFTK